LQWARTRLDAGKDANTALLAAEVWLKHAPPENWTTFYFRGFYHACLAAQRAKQGMAYQGEIALGIQALRESQRMNPRYVPTPITMADLALWLHQAGTPDEGAFKVAVAALDGALSLQPEQPELLFAQAKLGLVGKARWAGALGDPVYIKTALAKARAGNANLEGAIQNWWGQPR
jgi:hypothetical protein